MTQVCVTVTGKTMEEVRRARDAAAGADLIEVRLDGVQNPDPAAALDGRLRPVIVTCRPRWEGGAFDGSEDERRGILLGAITAGAEFVDVELRAAFAGEILRQRRRRGVVMSVHRFGRQTGDLAEQLRALRSTGAEVVKLAVEVDSLAATLPMFELGAVDRDENDQAEGQSHVLIAMGPRGAHTRVLSARLRNRWTYAGDGIAPGQMPAGRLLDEFMLRRIGPDTALYAVVGAPVEGSLSPAMHNAGFAHLGRDAAYVALHAKDADDFVTFAKAMDLRGGSITAPFKVDLLRHMDECEPLAREIGAVNTLHVQDGRWIGANTDAAGLVGALADRIPLTGTRVVVLGAGGAARAAAVGLKRSGARVCVSARRGEQAQDVASAAGVDTGTFPPEAGSWDVLVNAIPFKSVDESSFEDLSLDGRVVFDLTYAPEVTPLIARARQAGCETIGGIEMLTRQAERQFELWTGATPPRGLFRAAAEAAQGSKAGVRL